MLKTVRREAKEIIPVGIKVVEQIKKFVDSPTADFLTDIIPGELDNALKLTLRKIVGPILKGLREWQSITNITDENEQFKAIMEEFKALPKNDRDALKLQAATEINAALLPDVSITDTKILTLTAYHYPELLTNEKAS